MAKLEKTILINAPVDKVFGFMDEPTNLPEIWSSMVEVRNVKKMPQHVGSTFDWVYKMAGMRFEGSSQVTEWVANQREVTKSTKGIASTFTWMYKPENRGTRVTVAVEYTIPVPLLGKLAEVFIVKQNEHEAEGMLANLKARLEA